MMVSLVEELFSIRGRTFSHDDIKMWVTKVFETAFGITLDLIKTERLLTAVRGSGRGRVDIMLEGALAVDVKRDLSAEEKDAIQKLTKYAQMIPEEERLEVVFAATDGITWHFYHFLDGKLKQVGRIVVEKDWKDDRLISELLDKIALIREVEPQIKPTPDNVISLFGPYSVVFQIACAELYRIAEKSLTKKGKRSLFSARFLAWKETFGFVYSGFEDICKSLELTKAGEEKAHALACVLAKVSPNEETLQAGAIDLFVRHTYLATLAKMLVNLIQLRDDLPDLLEKDPASLLNGEELRKNQVEIIDRNDFYCWPADDSSREECKSLLKMIAVRLKRLQMRFDEDIFRSIYEEVVDSNTRHQLGEFYTPKWMAEHLAEVCIRDKNSRIIDPACGSGTFLVAAVKRLHQLGVRDAEDVLERVWGLDINPLSVMISRTTLYLSLFSLFETLPKRIRPNVFIGDALANYRRLIQKGIEDAEDTHDKYLVLLSERVHIRVPKPAGASCRKTALSEKVKFIERLVSSLESGTHAPEELVAAVEEIKKKYGNHVWYIILRNYSVVPVLDGEFDAVLSNPPWLTYREADEKLQRVMESVARRFGISPPARSKTSMNLAAVFLVACTRFLKKEGGFIGFVMPTSLIDAVHLKLLELIAGGERAGWHWSLAGPVYQAEDMDPPPFPHGLGALTVPVRVCRKRRD